MKSKRSQKLWGQIIQAHDDETDEELADLLLWIIVVEDRLDAMDDSMRMHLRRSRIELDILAARLLRISRRRRRATIERMEAEFGPLTEELD